MMTKVELETFVEGTTHYFETAANQPATVGSPSSPLTLTSPLPGAALMDRRHFFVWSGVGAVQEA